MKNQKLKKIVNTVLEPFAFGLLALLFIIPSITVVNLEPLTKKIKEMNVLGVSSTSTISLNVIGGTHQIFSREGIKESDGVYVYTTNLTKRNADRYSKPILEIINKKQEEVTVDIYGNTTLPSGSNISMIINDQVYKLQTPQGDILSNNIILLPNQKYIIYLVVENFSSIQFEDEFNMYIKELSE